MKRLLAASALLMLASPALAQTSLSLQIIVNCPASSSISISPASPWVVTGAYPAQTLTYPSASPLPVPANSAVGTIVLSPPGACVMNALTGANASSFTLSGYTLGVGATPLSGGSYAVTVSAP